MEKQFMMEKICRLLPSSLSSCHFRNIPDVIESSNLISRNHVHQTSSTKLSNSPKLIQSQDNKPTNLSDFFKLATRRVSVSDSEIIKTATPSSANTSGWFTNNEDAEIFDINETKPTSVSFSFSSSSSSSSSFEGSNSSFAASRRKTSENQPSRRDTEMGFSPSEVSVCVKADSSGELITQKNTEISCPKASGNGQGRVLKKLNEDDMGHDQISSFSSTHIYYGDCGSFRRCRKTTKDRRKTRKAGRKGSTEMITRSYGKVEESYTLEEKSSSDPYNDFRISMVEMILEKEIFGENELEKLLECFLYFNSAYYHDIIIRVFFEVCTTLFSPP